MKRMMFLVLCVILLGVLPVSADVGRDILLVHLQTNNWTGGDFVTVLTADGSRLVFDLDKVLHEIRANDEDLLFFLRTHALNDDAILYGAAAPVALTPITTAQADEIRSLLGKIEILPFELAPDKLDAGDFLTYAVLPVNGEAAMVLLLQAGNQTGGTSDPAALQLLALAGPYLMGE